MAPSNTFIFLFGVCYLGVTTLGSKIKWDSLNVSYKLGYPGYFNIPLRLGDIKKGEYVLLKEHGEFPDVSIYCYPDDPCVCPLYHKGGRIVGLRLSYVIKHLKKKTAKNKAFLPEALYQKPYYKEDTVYGQQVYYRDILFINPDTLKSGGRDTRKEPVGDGLYLNLDGEKWTTIQRKEVEAPKYFQKQACFLNMGMHYFYKISKEYTCDENPLALLYLKGELIGLAVQGYGGFENIKRKWFEDVPPKIVKVIIPNRNECVDKWVTDFGVTSLHIYFQKHTRTLCLR